LSGQRIRSHRGRATGTIVLTGASDGIGAAEPWGSRSSATRSWEWAAPSPSSTRGAAPEREALAGRFDAHHGLLVGEILAKLDYLDEAIERLSVEIDRLIAPFEAELALLDTIPGITQRNAEVILAEISPDMGRFGSAARLASWAGVCPGQHESAGKQKSGGTRKGSKWLQIHLHEAANAAARSKGTYLNAQYQRLDPDAGTPKPSSPSSTRSSSRLPHARPPRSLRGPRRGLVRAPQRPPPSRAAPRPPDRGSRLHRLDRPCSGHMTQMHFHFRGSSRVHDRAVKRRSALGALVLGLPRRLERAPSRRSVLYRTCRRWDTHWRGGNARRSTNAATSVAKRRASSQRGVWPTPW
jgi:Transposase IS116/IS110/IS902 family